MSETQKENKIDSQTEEKILECIQEALTGYVNNTKYFNADSLHELRNHISQTACEKVDDGKEYVVDVVLDLHALEEMPFFFSISAVEPSNEVSTEEPS